MPDDDVIVEISGRDRQRETAETADQDEQETQRQQAAAGQNELTDVRPKIAETLGCWLLRFLRVLLVAASARATFTAFNTVGKSQGFLLRPATDPVTQAGG